MALNLAVVESRWWPTGNASVQGLFELIATIHGKNSHDYHYEMFNNGASLKEIIRRVSGKKNIRNLYIAAHGNRRSIFGAEGNQANRISRDELGTSLGSVPNASLDGLYLSTCLTGNESTMGVLLDNGGISWISGYSAEIGWLEGACLDMYFWDCYCGSNNSGGPEARIRRIANKMRQGVLPLCKNLGFNIFIRGANGNPQPLLYA